MASSRVARDPDVAFRLPTDRRPTEHGVADRRARHQPALTQEQPPEVPLPFSMRTLIAADLLVIVCKRRDFFTEIASNTWKPVESALGRLFLEGRE